jgi:hypothetical protein
MPSLYAQIRTDRANRYLVQFCKHAAAMGSGGHTARMHLHAPMARREVQVTAEWSDNGGAVTFTPWGHCTLAADVGMLTMRIDAADDNGLAQIRDIIDRDFERFSRRDPLTVTWQRTDSPGAAPDAHTDEVTSLPRHGFRRPRLQTILIAAGVVIVIGAHIGLAGTVVAQSRWTGVAGNVLVAIIVLKIALIAGGRFAARRRRIAKNHALADDE